MAYTVLVIFISCMLAKIIERNGWYVANRNEKKCGILINTIDVRILYVFLILIVVLFSGLRGKYNDTGNYIVGFLKLNTMDGLFAFNGFEDGFGFVFFEKLIILLRGHNYVFFLTLTALITLSSYITFFRKYALDFSLSIYLLFTSTFFAFSMAAVRQCMAMAIAIWAIPLIIQKKYIKAIAVLLIASTIHTFVLLYAVAFFLREDIWKKKSILILVLTVFVSYGFSTFFNLVSDNFGYNVEDIILTSGTNLFRTLVWLTPAILSFVCRKNINDNTDDYGKIFINLSLIGSMIMILAALGGANLVARTAFYFFPFQILAFGEIFANITYKRNSSILKLLCIIFFFLYWYMLSRGVGLFQDYLQHNSFWELFS